MNESIFMVEREKECGLEREREGEKECESKSET